MRSNIVSVFCFSLCSFLIHVGDCLGAEEDAIYSQSELAEMSRLGVELDMKKLISAGYLGEKLPIDSVDNFSEFLGIYLFGVRNGTSTIEDSLYWGSHINILYLSQGGTVELTDENSRNYKGVSEIIGKFMENMEAIPHLNVTMSDRIPANFVIILQKDLVQRTSKTIMNVYNNFLTPAGVGALKQYISLDRKAFSIITANKDKEIHNAIIGVDLDIPHEILHVVVLREIMRTLGFAGGDELMGYDQGIDSIFNDKYNRKTLSNNDLKAIRWLYSSADRKSRSYKEIDAVEK